MPAVNLISTPPTFISQDEHTTLVGSTPNSFNDIPPVIRHKEEGVTVTLEPQLDGFSNVQGTLYVLTSVLAFVSTTGAGFQIEYPAITLHAVSRAESGPSIYCQLDESFGQANGAPSTNDEDSEMRELTIVPKSSDSLEPIFEALSQCASLHPDPHDDEEGDLDDAFVDVNGTTFETFNGDEDEELSEVGRAAFAHLNSIIDDPHNLLPKSDGEDDLPESESTENAT